MTEINTESIFTKLSDQEQRVIGQKLIDKGFAGIVIEAPAGSDTFSLALKEIKPQIIDIYNFTDTEFSGSREEFLKELRDKCDQLPDLGVGFSDYVFQHEAADWKGHEDPKTREKTALQWKLKSAFNRVRNMF